MSKAKDKKRLSGLTLEIYYSSSWFIGQKHRCYSVAKLENNDKETVVLNHISNEKEARLLEYFFENLGAKVKHIDVAEKPPSNAS